MSEKIHEPGCPRLVFWDAGEFEAPCICALIRDRAKKRREREDANEKMTEADRKFLGILLRFFGHGKRQHNVMGVYHIEYEEWETIKEAISVWRWSKEGAGCSKRDTQ